MNHAAYRDYATRSLHLKGTSGERAHFYPYLGGSAGVRRSDCRVQGHVSSNQDRRGDVEHERKASLSELRAGNALGVYPMRRINEFGLEHACAAFSVGVTGDGDSPYFGGR
jgi:hypothetical protein